MGAHVGGYTAFTVDVTDALAEENELLVAVRDGTDTNALSRGKQKTKRGGIWYTPQSGLWQTVWAEWVPERYITGLRITPDAANACVRVEVQSDYDGACYLHGAAHRRLYEPRDGHPREGCGAVVAGASEALCI